jgi:hypothetical protein
LVITVSAGHTLLPGLPSHPLLTGFTSHSCLTGTLLAVFSLIDDLVLSPTMPCCMQTCKVLQKYCCNNTNASYTGTSIVLPLPPTWQQTWQDQYDALNMTEPIPSGKRLGIARMGRWLC